MVLQVPLAVGGRFPYRQLVVLTRYSDKTARCTSLLGPIRGPFHVSKVINLLRKTLITAIPPPAERFYFFAEASELQSPDDE